MLFLEINPKVLESIIKNTELLSVLLYLDLHRILMFKMKSQGNL